MQIYKSFDALDKTMKPLILDWLADIFGYGQFEHSFKDQWVRWSVYGRYVSVGLDNRVPEQLKLWSLIPDKLKGCLQRTTLKVVNKDSFYLDIDRVVNLKYPDIVKSSVHTKVKHTDDDGDVFYCYEWLVELSDGSAVIYNNQKDVMDMVKCDYSYMRLIEERAFVQFITDKYKK